MEHIKSLPRPMQEFAEDVRKLLREDKFTGAYKSQFSKYKTRCFEGIWVKPAFHSFCCPEGEINEYANLIEDIIFLSQESKIEIIGVECVTQSNESNRKKFNREFVLTNAIIEKYDLLHLKDSMDQAVCDCSIFPSNLGLSVMIHEDNYFQFERSLDKVLRKQIQVQVDRCMRLNSEGSITATRYDESKKLIFLETLIPYRFLTQIAFGIPIRLIKI